MKLLLILYVRPCTRNSQSTLTSIVSLPFFMYKLLYRQKEDNVTKKGNARFKNKR